LWWTTDQTIHETFAASTRESVDVDLTGLVDIYSSGGQVELEKRINDRLALNPTDGVRAHYLLANRSGKRIAGDLTEWPDLDPAISESGEIAIGSRSDAYARATLISEGLQLLVAHEQPERSFLLAKVSLVFLLGGAVFVACTALFAQIASARVRDRVRRVSDAFRRHDEPALDRMAAPRNPDEIDQIASQASQAVKRARQLTEAYRDTSEQIAHEIRTPLMHLDSRIMKAIARQPDQSTTAEMLEARADIKRLVGTLEALLDIAASKADRGDWKGMNPVDFSSTVRQICELYQDSAEEAGYHLEWEIAEDVIVLGDESQLRRIVTNLLDNAFKYNRPGGDITVSLQPGPRLSVVDQGPGIPAAEREKIFERFYRGTTAGSGTQGSGMGLALARAIAQRHDLFLDICDDEGGARFVLSPGEGSECV
jgi:signal transduction histidine kinase